ncbi:MAG TPA: NAD(P)/FAD-dependent oxidoreductase [Candidatus Limnocylindrales bacterium]
MFREASAAGAEAAATGAPIDEVTDLRAERRVEARARAGEALEAYNDAVRRVAERGGPEDVAARWVAAENLKRVGRRDFLKGAGMAAVALAAAAAQPRVARAATGKQPSIAIVGGGLAGLRAAHMLWTKYGWTSTIYEASSRIGGRVETQRGYWANGLVAEMHGEFISSEHASMLNLVKLFNLGLDDTRAYAAGTDDTYWVNGGRYTQAQLNADWQAWARTLFNNAVKTVPWPQRYNSYNATGYQWDHMSVPTWMNQYMPGGTSSNFGGVCLQSQIDEYGGDPSDQSALNLTFILGYYDSANGRGYQPVDSPYLAGTDERWHVTGGNDLIATGMAGQLPPGTVQLGQALIALKANANGTYTLTLQSGAATKQVTVNSVILALPFVTLRNVDLSAANLPTLKTTAINTMGMGTNAKVIMEFGGEPWIADGYTGTTYQDNGFISSGWQMVQSAASGGYTGPTSLWTAFPGGNDTQTIVNTYGLSASSGVPPTRLVNDTLKQLEPVLPGVTTGYTGRAWYDFGILDPYTLGGYSFYRVGQYTGISGYEAVPVGRIHFAGEHTSPDFQGFMEGAVVSGERCAAEVQPNG